jgi:hypothetical protein
MLLSTSFLSCSPPIFGCFDTGCRRSWLGNPSPNIQRFYLRTILGEPTTKDSPHERTIWIPILILIKILSSQGWHNKIVATLEKNLKLLRCLIRPSLRHDKHRSFLLNRLDLVNRTDPGKAVRNGVSALGRREVGFIGKHGQNPKLV